MGACRTRRFVVRYFRCQVCGLLLTATKNRLTDGSKQHRGHIKTMWCPKCQDMEDFVLTDSDLTRA